jgi:hypothetical protein
LRKIEALSQNVATRIKVGTLGAGLCTSVIGDIPTKAGIFLERELQRSDNLETVVFELASTAK